jgi:hypothetical protein
MLGRREFIQRAAVATALLGIPKARAEEAFARGPDAEQLRIARYHRDLPDRR